MAYTYPVKWITNTMRGAPPISGTPSALIGALDAFLLTGWGVASAISVTVSGGVGTATFAEGSYFEDYAVVLITGVTTPAALNGEARVLSHTNKSITFETDAPDGTATTGGAITFKYAPVGGWEKSFYGTHLAGYRSIDPQSHGHFLRVDDAGSMSARVLGFEAMTDVASGGGPFPTAAMFSGGGYWHKSGQANTAPARYALAADSLALLTAIEPGTPGNPLNRATGIRGFGSPIALAPGGDPWATFLSASESSPINYVDAGAFSGGRISGLNGFIAAPRAYAGLGSALYLNPVASSGLATNISGIDAFAGAAPSSVDGQIKLSRMMLREQATGAPFRCIVPGVLYVPQTGVINFVAPGDMLTGAQEWAGRKLLAVGLNTSAAIPTGIALIDLFGPWR